MRMHVAMAVLLGLSFGILTAYLAITIAPEFLWVHNEVWKTSLLMGSGGADPYTRAIIAKNALYVLNSSEAVYYIATGDGERAFSRNCDYLLVGKKLPARWWSVTVYGEDNFLIENEYDIYSITSANVKWEGEIWKIYISKEKKGENWIPLRGEGGFYITLRLYNPEKEVYDAPDRVELPKVVREKCG